MFLRFRVPCAAAIFYPLPQTWDSQSQCPGRGLHPTARSQFYRRHPKGLGKCRSHRVGAPKLFEAAANLLHIVLAVAWLLCHGLGSPHPQLNRIRKSHLPSRTLTGSSRLFRIYRKYRESRFRERFNNGSPGHFNRNCYFRRGTATGLTESIHKVLQSLAAVLRAILLNHFSLAIEQYNAMILRSPINTDEIV